jgi:hypothetical protein
MVEGSGSVSGHDRVHQGKITSLLGGIWLYASQLSASYVKSL